MNRAQDGRSVSFDLHGSDGTPDDGTPDGAPSDPTPSDPTPSEPAPTPPRAPRRLRTWWRTTPPGARRRRLALIGGGAVVLVAAGLAVAAVQERAQADRLRAAPGGVVGLEAGLTQAWHVDADALGAVLPEGGLAVVDGEALVAHDVADGSVRWNVTLGEAPACGPVPRRDGTAEWAMPQERVTCLHGPDERRTVTVVSADGTVLGTRALPADRYGGEHRHVVPGPDGGIVVADYDPGVPALLEFSTTEEVFAELPDLTLDTAAAAVHVEDAVTGEVRRPVPLTGLDATSGAVLDCYRVRPSTLDPEGPGSRVVADLEPPVPRVTSTLVDFHGCGVDGAISHDGMPLGSAEMVPTSIDAGTAPTASRQTPYPGGGFVVPSPDGDVRVDDAGATLAGQQGLDVVAPAATDGRESPVTYAVDGTDDVMALGPDGTERWRFDADDPVVLLSTPDVVVVQAWSRLTGLDPGFGTELWSVAPSGDPVWWGPTAVTDGERLATTVAVAGSDGERVQPELLVVDLASGELLPGGDLDGPATAQLVAVDGHPVWLSVAYGEEGAVVEVSVSGLAPAS